MDGSAHCRISNSREENRWPLPLKKKFFWVLCERVFTTKGPVWLRRNQIETDIIITTKVAKHALSNVEGSTKEKIEM
jgi:hypothetical protein